MNFSLSKNSFSQSGEDIIMDYVKNWLGINEISYLDIGCNHPIKLNNTYLFYLQGHTGVCVEPDPDICKIISKFRKKDICLNVGVDSKIKSAKFYIMSSNPLSTSSKYIANRYISFGKQKIEQVISIPMMTINDIIDQYFSTSPDIISIDTEGNDYSILKSLDFKLYQPKILCVETLNYTENKTARKKIKIIRYLKNKGFFVYADTYINTIFVNNIAWSKRLS